MVKNSNRPGNVVSTLIVVSRAVVKKKVGPGHCSISIAFQCPVGS